eukprot:Gb_14376 [translate_table: standard]
MGLEKIGEDVALCSAGPAMSYPPPETPKEPMEFLARSWSISALEVSKALEPLKLHSALEEEEDEEEEEKNASKEESKSKAEEWPPVMTPITFGSSETSQLACTNLSSAKTQLKGKTVGRWLKEKKQKRREENRAHNAEVHAAMSVGGVAAAVAAITAATATNGASKTSMAVASAAALVAAQCAEIAVCMGADRQQMASVISSAVNVKTPGDIMTLTAGAATALRGVAALQARAMKDIWNNAAVIPYEKGSNPSVGFSGELVPGDSDSELCSQDMLARGCELLKRTRKGDLHWKMVFVYIKNGEVSKQSAKHPAVVVKLKSKHMGGIVFDVYKDMPAWPGREELEGGDERCYFGLETARGVIQFECRNHKVHQICTQGVARLLSLTQHHKSR